MGPPASQTVIWRFCLWGSSSGQGHLSQGQLQGSHRSRELQGRELGRGRKGLKAKGPLGSGISSSLAAGLGHCPGVFKRRRLPSPGLAAAGREEAAVAGTRGKGRSLVAVGPGDAIEPNDCLAPVAIPLRPPSTRPAAGNAPRARPAVATSVNSRAVCACLFLSLEVAPHFHFLLPFGSSAGSVSA